MDDQYLTIAEPATQEIKVKGSRFIARTELVTSADDATGKLDEIRKHEHAATHNCYAFVTGVPGETAAFKYSDDGEPSGTAGRPIYDVISGNGITNILLVVTRYFGGTKLGTGGLVKAYSEAAKLALKGSGVKENFISDRLKVEIDFSVYDKLIKTTARLGAKQAKADFSDIVSLELEIRRGRTEELMTEITQLSKGKAKVEKI